jgi:hypothetical protein
MPTGPMRNPNTMPLEAQETSVALQFCGPDLQKG